MKFVICSKIILLEFFFASNILGLRVCFLILGLLGIRHFQSGAKFSGPFSELEASRINVDERQKM